MLVKIVHVKYCPANWQTALQQHRFSSLRGVSPPPPQQLHPCPYGLNRNGMSSIRIETQSGFM